MSNPFDNPIMPSFPKGKVPMADSATRVSAHRTDGVKNDLSSVTMASKPAAKGKLGLTGDGKQK